MRVYYDLHIHSALSPCGDNEMTPQNIAAMAAVKGLDAIAVSDHNSIKNVSAVMAAGGEFGLIVVPAMEVQTSEDVHILALFYTYADLEKFDLSLEKIRIKNREDIYGEQLVMDCEGNITGKEENLLLVGVRQNIYGVCSLIKQNGGVAVLAHIDRDENGIIPTLGEIPPDLEFDAVEFSLRADKAFMQKYSGYTSIRNSDSHRLPDISEKENYLECKEASVKYILDSIKEHV